ncbi:5'-methylthioadenosine/adenosylhomocysteine nucleosidase [Atopococcus tabaci]|uniref:5'-methylthioadenosine/adenosylhomocysteine nucleosidase n=1 Tax=Atopococcus tabaci TaxID=269774 RepID=UPI0003FF1E52|nr:5'-methylthioadenosine/adenosylhomocysteine nucleosidase [Atopococcus tabaci]
MKKIGIIGAMEEETRILLQSLEQSETKEIAGSTYLSGVIDDVPVTLVQSGIGKVNAAVATTILLHEFKTDVVINTGSAGAIGTGLKIGDVVLSNRLAYHDADARVFGYDMGQIPQMPPAYEADAELVRVMNQAAEEAGLQTLTGEIVTGDSFVSARESLQAIKEYFPDALVTEMEGAAIAQVCWRFNVPFVVVRAVSDSADEEAGVNFDEFIVEAGRKSAQMVLNFIGAIKQR